ncbi:MAG: hypothetical protein ACKOW3_05745 [Hyphomicrobium sp.]
MLSIASIKVVSAIMGYGFVVKRIKCITIASTTINIGIARADLNIFKSHL